MYACHGIAGHVSLSFLQAHGIIFVLDSNDAQRLSEAKKALGEVMSHGKVLGKPLLV